MADLRRLTPDSGTWDLAPGVVGPEGEFFLTLVPRPAGRPAGAGTARGGAGAALRRGAADPAATYYE